MSGAPPRGSVIRPAAGPPRWAARPPLRARSAPSTRYWGDVPPGPRSGTGPDRPAGARSTVLRAGARSGPAALDAAPNGAPPAEARTPPSARTLAAPGTHRPGTGLVRRLPAEAPGPSPGSSRTVRAPALPPLGTRTRAASRRTTHPLAVPGRTPALPPEARTPPPPAALTALAQDPVRRLPARAPGLLGRLRGHPAARGNHAWPRRPRSRSKRCST